MCVPNLEGETFQTARRVASGTQSKYQIAQSFQNVNS